MYSLLMSAFPPFSRLLTVPKFCAVDSVWHFQLALPSYSIPAGHVISGMQSKCGGAQAVYIITLRGNMIKIIT